MDGPPRVPADVGPAPVPSAERLAHAWAEAVADTGFVPMHPASLVALLTGPAADLLAAWHADTVDRAAVRRAGAALVDAHFTETASVERTLAVLGRELAASTPSGVERLAQLLGAVAAGYAQALHDRTRREHERISASAFAAQTAAEQARWDSEVRFRTVFAEAAIGIGLADTEGRILEVNRALADMLGHSQDALRGVRIWTFVRPDDVPGLWDRAKELLSGERDQVRVDKACYRPDGTAVWTESVVSLVRDRHGAPQYAVAMVENITERHRLQLRLQHQALHDPLTDLPNRTLFFERLDAALQAGTHPGVCYLDLDGFKAVNDTLGHDFGDRLLCAVARRLTEAVGAEQLVARMGGDEFVVLAEALEAGGDGDERLHAIAQSALAAVRRPVRLPGRETDTELVVSASIGVVRADGGRDAAELMKAADTTLYWAKADGRNRCALFDEERHRSDVDRFAVSGRMPDALARGEFSLEFQPLVRLADRAAVGVEALLRWTTPDGTRLDPGRFVPLAEESGFIVPLGRWVLEQACRAAAAWAAADPATQVLMSVNVAARQVRERSFADDVAAVLTATGWPARRLQLELTESALMGSPDGSPAALHALAGMGVRIAIDDFGTGYSNLAYLRRLPVHALKLAGSFVTGAAGRDGRGRGADAVDREVVGLVIRLAHTLGLTVTAESVETADQCADLRRMGCDTGQGWFFAAPVPAGEIPSLVAGPLGR